MLKGNIVWSVLIVNVVNSSNKYTMSAVSMETAEPCCCGDVPTLPSKYILLHNILSTYLFWGCLFFCRLFLSSFVREWQLASGASRGSLRFFLNINTSLRSEGEQDFTDCTALWYTLRNLLLLLTAFTVNICPCKWFKFKRNVLNSTIF